MSKINDKDIQGEKKTMRHSMIVSNCQKPVSSKADNNETDGANKIIEK